MGAHGSNLDDILEEDMHHWYTKFMRESPSGLIMLFELKTMLEMNGMTEEASSYVDQVFVTFDMDGVWKHLILEDMNWVEETHEEYQETWSIE